MRFKTLGIVFAFVSAFVPWFTAHAATSVRVIFYPTDATLIPNDDFGSARVGHHHAGNDIMGSKMTPLYATVDGVVKSINIPEASWGYAIVLEDADGYTYHYLHVNNDTPGKDDGKGGLAHAYAPGMAKGVFVKKGQLIAWMGDSGNAETVGSHLHFEIRTPTGAPINPQASLVVARKTAIEELKLATVTATMTIDSNQGLVQESATTTVLSLCKEGGLMKGSSSTAVFYCGADGKRHAFPNASVFASWYRDFSQVKTIPEATLAEIPVGQNVIYSPTHVALVKRYDQATVYAVLPGGVLRPIVSPTQAENLYGSRWATRIAVLSNDVFADYEIGDPIAPV